MQIWLYTTSITSRLQWVAQWLNDQLGDNYLVLTENKNDFGENDRVINYTEQRLPQRQQCHIVPQGLLHSKTIHPQNISFGPWQNLPVFFLQDAGLLPFDILAASFYLLQRYEEHLPHTLDEYGRYHHINSLAFKHRFLHRPLVDEWVNELMVLIEKSLDLNHLRKPSFQHLPTYDIDMAWSTRHKGGYRNAGALAKTILSGDLKGFSKKLSILSGVEKDPFFIFEDLERLHQKLSCRPLYFWLLAEKAIGYDKNISPHHPVFKKLIKRMAQKADCGIHLSWQAEKDGRIMAKECTLLEEILESPIHKNRFHYLNIHLPDSYRRMLQHCPNITDDYSMAYGTINGFRASTARPYRWYNLIADKASELMLHPAAWMDANCIFEEKLSPIESINQWNDLKEQIANAGGNFITIAHNHFMANDKNGKPWKEGYYAAIEQTERSN